MTISNNKQITDDSFSSSFSYFESNDFEIRFGLSKNYNYHKDNPNFAKFEIRIRNDDAELTDALFQKIREWTN